MSMPQIPTIVTGTININREEVINLLLASIAMEELGLAHIMNAEAEKIQAVLGTLPGAPSTVQANTFQDLLTIDRSVGRILRSVIKKDMLLQFKLEDIISILPPPPTPPPPPGPACNGTAELILGVPETIVCEEVDLLVVVLCDGVAVQGVPVTFELSDTGADFITMDTPTGTTDSNGTFSTQITVSADTGPSPGQPITVKATAHFSNQTKSITQTGYVYCRPHP